MRWQYINLMAPSPLHSDLLNQEFGARGWRLASVLPVISESNEVEYLYTFYAPKGAERPPLGQAAAQTESVDPQH